MDIFKRERFYILLRVMMASGAVNVALIILVVILSLRQPQNHYFLTDPDGHLTPIVALNQPIEAAPVVGEWTLQAVINAYSFGFANYQAQLSKAQGDFTEAGWLGFQDGLKSSGDLDAVVNNKLDIAPVATGAPVVTNFGLNANGRYQWIFQFPMTFTYESADQKMSRQYVASVTVVRVPESFNPRGLGIEKILLQ